MIKIEWEKGSLTLSGSMPTLLMENALIVSGLARILMKEGFKDEELKKILISQVETGLKMTGEEAADYISDAKYERGVS